MGAHHRDYAACGIGRALESFALPLHQCRLHVLTFRLAVQHVADGGAVMREIGMQPHKALIAGVVDPGDDVPRRWRRLAIDAQVTLTAALDDRMTHIDCDLLRLATAKLPDLRGGHCSRGNTGLRRGRYAKRRR